MFFFCLVFAMPLCAPVCMCLVVTCWERASDQCLHCLRTENSTKIWIKNEK